MKKGKEGKKARKTRNEGKENGNENENQKQQNLSYVDYNMYYENMRFKPLLRVCVLETNSNSNCSHKTMHFWTMLGTFIHLLINYLFVYE